MKNRFFALLICISVLTSAKAVDIVRYVAEGGMGDGLSKENPTGDLKAVLEMSRKVDKVTIYASPGTFSLPLVENPDARPIYRNVYLYGGGASGLNEAPDKTVIEGDLEIRDGLITNIDFKGADYKDRFGRRYVGTLRTTGCQIYYTDASVIEYKALPSYRNQLYEVKAKSLYIKRDDNSYGKPSMDVYYCNVSGGKGVEVEHVSVNFQSCVFSRNTRGVYLYGTEPSMFSDCWFVGNFAQGALNVDIISDNISALLKRCVFAENASTDKDCSSVVYGVAPFLLNSCLIAKNKRHSGYGQSADAWVGAVELHRRQSRIINCTFWENEEAAIYYWMGGDDHYNAPPDQILNCVFLNNKLPYVSYYSDNSPKMMYCAADFGSDIPELDAEMHNMRINAQNIGMTVDARYNVVVEEGSPLINGGWPYAERDIYGVSHYMLGGTDLGCAEYVGDWKVSDSQKKLTLDGDEYVLCETVYKGAKYYAYVDRIATEGGVFLKNSVYLGNNISPVNTYGDGNVVVGYTSIEGKKQALMYQPTFPIGWSVTDIMNYDGKLPVAAKKDGIWRLQIPTSSATAKTGSAKNAGSRQSTSTRKTGTKRR